MNQSTEGVTLIAQYLQDVIDVTEKLNYDSTAIKAIASKISLENPFEHVPMAIYNEMCQKVEDDFGIDAVRKVGEQIGETVHTVLSENNIIQGDDDPFAIIAGLEIAATSTVQDPEGRGWEILEEDEDGKRLVMRRTQTFNSQLQFGLLKGLISKSPKVEPDSISVKYLFEVAKGDDFDDYEITWQNKS